VDTVRTCRSSRALAVGLAMALTLAWPVASTAGLYKCARDDNTVMYQEDPCPAGRELRDFERDPATVSVVPFSTPPPASATDAAPRRASNGTKELKSSKASTRQGSTARAVKGGSAAINPAERKFLVPGIGEGEVVARIGRPDMSTGAGRKTVRWTYLPAPEDPSTITTLTFELGRLIQVERRVVRTR
jgi:hypothetical protein